MQACRIAVRDLACRRGDRVLFSGLTLEVGAGEVVQVAGRNGAGKSSLLRILAGLLAPFAGRMERSGSLGLVDERPALDPALPLGRALAFWQRIDGGDCSAAAQRLGLTGLLDVPVRYLSTGQRKRAALSRLIAQDAGIWLLDEPLNGLDREGTALLHDLVAAHAAAGGLAVVASHQPFEITARRVIDLANFAT